MRIYRGKAKDTGKWVYGYLLIHIDNRCEILQRTNDIEEFISIDQSTMGEAIGKRDVNGQEIYVDDIVEYFDWCYASGGVTQEKTHLPDYAHYYGSPDRGKKIIGYYKPLIGIVEWNYKYMTYEPMVSSCDDYNHNSFAYVCSREQTEGCPRAYFKVIGNIFDNENLISKENAR